MNTKNIIIALLLGIILAGGGLWFYTTIYNKSVESSDVSSQIPDYKAESVAVGPVLKTGTYKLEGYNGSLESSPSYVGEVDIIKTGEVYKIAWYIGSQQDQRGVGILESNTLSVGYVDLTGGAMQDMGVVSYLVVNSGKLEGKWSSVLGTETGREVLTWESSL